MLDILWLIFIRDFASFMSEAKPCVISEDVNKPMVRVVEPKKNIDSGEHKLSRR